MCLYLPSLQHRSRGVCASIVDPIQMNLNFGRRRDDQHMPCLAQLLTQSRPQATLQHGFKILLSNACLQVHWNASLAWIHSTLEYQHASCEDLESIGCLKHRFIHKSALGGDQALHLQTANVALMPYCITTLVAPFVWRYKAFPHWRRIRQSAAVPTISFFCCSHASLGRASATWLKRGNLAVMQVCSKLYGSAYLLLCTLLVILTRKPFGLRHS